MDGYQHPRIPERIAVCCRSCAGPAEFAPGFEYLAGDAARRAATDPAAVGVAYAGGFLRNRFPYLNGGRKSPRAWYGRTDGAVGVVTCARCVSRYEYALRWPADAYYRVETRGGTLWAWNREYLVLLRDFIAAERRDAAAARLYFRRKIPRRFLLAKRREDMTAKINRVLAKT